MRIITTVCWLVTGFVLTGLAVWFLTGTVFGFQVETRGFRLPFSLGFGGWDSVTGAYELAGAYGEPAAGINSLEIDWISGMVTVMPHDGADISITEYSRRELRDDETLRFDRSGGTLKIWFRERGAAGNIVIGNVPSKQLEVLVPRALYKDLSAFTVDSVSARVIADGLGAGVCKVKTTSGGISLSNVSSGNFKADSTSGTITVTSVSAETMDLHSTSGAIHVNGSSAGSLDCNTSSGGIIVDGAFGYTKLHSSSGRLSLNNTASGSTLNASTVSGSHDLSGAFDAAVVSSSSGRVSFTSAVVPSSLKASSSSGNIDITVPGGAPVTVRHSSSSGRFSSDVAVIMHNSPDAQFNLSATSGNVRILELG